MTGPTLDGALDDLDRIVASTRDEGSRLGLFPAMYRQVTRSIRLAVERGGLFDDDDRLERLGAIFASRYVEAFDDHRAGRPTARCWRIAFVTAEAPHRRMILQHLLMGMNAHINLDLGISTADVGGTDMASLQVDYLRVNEILFAMVDRLQEALGDVSPRMALLDRWGRSWDEAFMRIGIRRARALAWPFACRIAATDYTARFLAIQERDEDAEFLGRLISRRWSPIHLLGRFVSAAETNDVAAVMDALGRVEIDPFDTTAPVPEVLLVEDQRLRDQLSRRRWRRSQK